jgi:hypothetical protein
MITIVETGQIHVQIESAEDQNSVLTEINSSELDIQIDGSGIEIIIENSFLKGPQGPQGIQGPIGQTGPQGPAGNNAPSIHSGLTLDDGTNPHGTTKTDVGLSNVQNTDTTTTANITDSSNKRFVTDAEKTVIGNTSGVNTGDQDLSSYAQTANVVLKADYAPAHSILVQQSGTGSPSILQVSNNTIIGRKSGGGSDIEDLSATDAKVILALENVDNTSDLDKPISTATQTALNLKQDIFDPNISSYFFDDFFGGLNITLGWVTTNSGAGANFAVSTYGLGPTFKPLGIQRLSTGTTATGRAAISRAINAFSFGLCAIEQTWRIALEQLSVPLQRFVVYVGFHDQPAAGAPAEGAYFVYADSLGPNWLCITRDNNVQTTNDSGVAANVGYNRFKIVVNETGTEVQFFINDILVATSLTNIPNNVNRGTGISCKIESITGTTLKLLNIDYYYHKFVVTGGRS